MKRYKPLPQNPLVQRMEDMQIPGMKKKGKTKFVNIKKEDMAGEYNFVPPELGSELTLNKLEAQFRKAFNKRSDLDADELFESGKKWFDRKMARIDEILKDNDKVPHTREYLRPISDPHHNRHMFIKFVLLLAIMYCVTVLL